MKLKNIVGKIHLWLGLSSGLVVFIVAVTGCIYAFQEEIQDMTQPYRFVQPQKTPVLPPTTIWEKADQAFPGKHLHAVLYPSPDRAAQAIYYSYEENYYYFVYVNPYSGEVLKIKDVYADFFRIVLDGHFYLWLPPEIGQPLVASFTLVFLVMVISGLILWWPKKKKNLRNSLKIKWKARWRRKNYDLHQVLGFYVMAFACIFAITGLVWGFVWFRDAVFFVSSGGEDYVEYYTPLSDSTAIYQENVPPLDAVWMKMRRMYPNAEWIEVHPPEFDHAAIAANANPDASTYWKMDYRYFDQNTLQELPVDHIYNRFDEASFGDKVMRMNYDLHVGAIAGLPGKILAFFLSAIIASLPITGFMIWWGRKNKNKKMERSGDMNQTPAGKLISNG
ncbi:MAG: PepSY domain-containing protein [Cytophagales bacterium]|uniref:PepSY-associated TM helix domain-containing protein n=1 Tax=Cyclobacterium marinum TaxID=104 RepID=UPI0030D969B7|nr:PepSY domain-containing protein [Cytophagales bacterium]|tara:strand:- start:126682 stop:127854 length:1173 start_codon:yes stop_codon:yes gene_type:complete